MFAQKMLSFKAITMKIGSIFQVGIAVVFLEIINRGIEVILLLSNKEKS